MINPLSHLLALLVLAAPMGPDVLATNATGDGWLGVSLTEAADGRPQVVEVVPDSPAESAGLRVDDVFLSVDGVATADLDALIGQLRSKDSGDRVRLQVRRGEDTVEISVTLASRPADEGDAPAPPVAGKTRTGQAPGVSGKAYAGVALEDSAAGVRVVRVLPDSPAAAAGLLVGDVVRAVGNRSIDTIDALDAMLQRARPGQQVALRVGRSGADVRVALTLGAVPDPTPAATPAAPPPSAVFAADPTRALASARQAGRRVLLVFGAAWCGACHAQRRALADAALAPQLATHEIVWVDAELHGKLADEYGVQSLPHLFVLAGDGKPIVAREGYQPVANLGALLAEGAAEPPPQPVEAAADRLGTLRRELAELRREVTELRELLRRRASGGR